MIVLNWIGGALILAAACVGAAILAWIGFTYWWLIAAIIVARLAWLGAVGVVLVLQRAISRA